MQKHVGVRRDLGVSTSVAFVHAGGQQSWKVLEPVPPCFPRYGIIISYKLLVSSLERPWTLACATIGF